MLVVVPGLGVVLGIAGAGLLIGWILLWRASAASRRGWIYRRAPRLPIDVLAEHDDAWIEGEVASDDPLVAPWFEVPCASYEYQIEREIEETEEDEDGNRRTSTRWDTVHSEERITQFQLVSDDGAITIDLPNARSVDYATERDQCGDLRYSLSYLPIGLRLSVLGVKHEGDVFGPFREIPLVLSRKTHEKLMIGAVKGEGRRRLAGLIVSSVALAVAVIVYANYVPTEARWSAVPIATALALAVWLPLWWVSTFNRFVRQREQVHAAWRQIDVDLAVRNALLPNYQRVVSGYAEHEESLQAKLAELRTELVRPDVVDDIAGRGHRSSPESEIGARVETDRQTSDTVRSLLAITEDYPNLKADTLFADLHRKLWALEEKLTASRDFYNGCARQWNELVLGFPSSLVARFAGHESRPYFEG